LFLQVSIALNSFTAPPALPLFRHPWLGLQGIGRLRRLQNTLLSFACRQSIWNDV